MKYPFGEKLKVGILCKDFPVVVQYMDNIAFVLPYELRDLASAAILSLDIVIVEETYMDWGTQNNKLPIPIIILAKDKVCAFEALKYGVVDMLIKPCSQKHFENALLKAMERIKRHLTIHIEGDLLKSGYPRVKGVYFQFKSIRQKVVSVDFRKIRMCVADGNLTYIMLGKQRKEIGNFSISHCEALSQALGFVRIHRKFIVNLAFVESVDDSRSGIRSLKIFGYEEEMPIARRRWKDFCQIYNQFDRS